MPFAFPSLPSLRDHMDHWRHPNPMRQPVGLDYDHDDLLLYPGAQRSMRRYLSSPYAYYRRPWSTVASRKDAGSTVKVDKDQFEVSLDVQQFTPKEITVKVIEDNTITVEGKHEEKEDDHGSISRHFVRRYTLPKGHDITKIASKLSSDGILTITAPKEKTEVKHREIPIIQTGKPSDAFVDKDKGGEDKMECESDVTKKKK